jgi:hypothetical protein
MTGSTSAAAANLKLHIVRALPSQRGYFAYGNYLINVPYQGGMRYMGTPIVRLTSVVLDTSGATSVLLPITPDMYGATRVYQFWYRDPAHADGTHAGLTNALKLTFKP